MNRLAMPVDEATHVPYPIVIQAEGRTDLHHPYFPAYAYVPDKTHIETTEHDLAIVALHDSRVQEVCRWDHVTLHRIFDGPAIPEDPFEMLSAVIMSSAGFVPPKGVVVYNGLRYDTVDLKPKQRSDLWDSGAIAIGYANHVKIYLLKYAIEHGLRNVSEPVIDEFLYTSKALRRQQLGMALLNAASDAALDEARPGYSGAREAGLLPPFRPEDVGTYVTRLLFPAPDSIEPADIDRMKSIVRKAYYAQKAA